MKRRILACMLCVCMVLGMLPVNALAEEEVAEWETVSAHISLTAQDNVVSLNVDEPGWNVLREAKITWDDGITATVGVSADFVLALSSGISAHVSNPEKGETAAGEFFATASFMDESGGVLSYTGTMWTLTFEEASHTVVTLYDENGNALDSVTIGHIWDDGVVTKKATCTEDGVITYTCTECGKKKTEAIAASHTWDDGVVTKEPTDTEYGEITYTCTICEEKKTERYMPPVQLSMEVNGNSVSVKNTAAYWNKFLFKLSWDGDCEATVVEDEAFRSWEFGSGIYGYSAVNDSFSDKILVAGAYSPGKEPEYVHYVGTLYTFTFDGADHLVVTLYDDTSDSANAIQSVTVGHTWDAGVVTKEATCTEEGSATYTCTKCGVKKTEAIPVTHAWGEGVITKEATCTEDGVATFTCLECGETKTEVLDGSYNHVWDDGIVTREATCTENGVRKYTCTVCGATETRTVYAAHTWDEGVVTKEVTCMEDGIITYTCAICGKTRTESIDATGHKWDVAVIKEASCSKEGGKRYTCSVCGETHTEVYDKYHVWHEGIVTKEPTCAEAGEIVYTCILCGEKTTKVIPATGEHTWDNGVITEKMVSCYRDENGLRHSGTNGEILYTCTACGETKTETISCHVEVGNRCLICGSSWTSTSTTSGSRPKERCTRHTWGEGRVTEEGIKYYCTECGATRVETIGGHAWDNGTLVGDEIIYTCTICGEKSNIGPETDHEWDDGIVAGNRITYTCKVCGETKTVDLFETTETGNDVVITGYNGKDQTVTIPSKIDGRKVVAIGEFAFESEDIKKVEIPSTVTSIDICAFYRCEELAEVTIPSSVTAIGYGAFMNCTSLKEVTLEGEKVPEFDTYAFSSKNLQTIYVPDASYDAYVAALSGLVESTVEFKKLSEKKPSNETPTTDAPDEPKYETGKVDDGVEISGFDGTETTVTIPAEIDGEAVTAIGKNAFANSNVKKVVLPASVKRIDAGAFANCENLESIVILGDEITIASDAFEGCGSVTIKCLKNSAAQQYAKDHGLQYESLYYYGDVDLSGDLSASDALSILKCVVKLTDFTDATVKALAHASHQSEIGASDALAVLKIVVKLSDAELMIP